MALFVPDRVSSEGQADQTVVGLVQTPEVIRTFAEIGIFQCLDLIFFGVCNIDGVIADLCLCKLSREQALM